MSLVCELTGKKRFKANKVSHSNIKTRRFKYPNLTKKKWKIQELNQTHTLTLSAAALKIINARGGIARAILEEKDGNLSDRLLRVKRDLVKKNRMVAIKAAASRMKGSENEVEN
jgi:large subunit ribosomal protein L28